VNTPLHPATLAFLADGTPYSEIYGDVYHSADGGLGQAHHVFLAGNGLPGRWRRQERFVIVETGFGLGLNFLATWAAWRDDAERPRRLHFVSFELHPFHREDLARLHARWPAFAPLSAELLAQWPLLVAGMHRLHLDGGRVELTLYFGDARDGLAQLDACADAFFLDGFSPAKNPDLWSAKVCHLLARCAAPGATLATWSVAGSVREELRRAWFETEKAPGFGGKRQMLRGTLHPRARPSARRPAPPAERHAIIVGAGAAGSTVAERLAARGWSIESIDAHERAGQGASGNHAGVLRPLPSLDDCRISRLTRAGTLYGLRHLARLEAAGLPVRFGLTGVLHLARDTTQEMKMRATVARLQLPRELLDHVDAARAGELAGWAVESGGWFFPGSGWVQPHSLCAANLAAHPKRIRCHWNTTVARIERHGELWRALRADGGVIAAAPVLILAAGVGLCAFAAATAIPLLSARGQVSVLAAASASPPRLVICRGGYVTPAVEGKRCAGATFDVDDPDPHPRLADHQANLAKLENILPGYTASIDASTLDGRVGFRPLSPDRLPLAGAVPVAAAVPPGARLADLPRHPGLYVLSGFGSRGLVWATLIGELLAARIEGEPLPIERDLAEALDPARFLLRARRAHMTSEETD
jgi:tRNA 5-methylaminomethyl-2-thiouridine biosynthesis bifunctional protein